MTAGRLDVLVVGDLNPDLLVSGEELAPRWGQAERDAEMRLVLGGSAGIAAAGMARIGLRTALCATIGDDDFGAAARRMLAEHGVEDDGADDDPRQPDRPLDPSARGRRPRDLHRARRDGRADRRRRRARRSSAAAPRHVHLAAVYLLPALHADGGAIVDAAHAARATVSVDTNFDPAERFERPAWLTRADALLPNATEARADRPPRRHRRPRSEAARHARSRRRARRRQAGRAGCVRARRRAASLPRRRARPNAPRSPIARPATPFADAVGAGDSFDAGIVRALVDGRPLRDALAFACAAGTLSTRAAGGTAAQATHDEAARLAKELLR